MEGPRLRSGVTPWQPGDRLGPFTLSHVLGTGYNGEVWAARDSDLRLAAVKVRRENGDPWGPQRFEREIAFLRDHGQHTGVLPIRDDGGFNAEPRWYSMPIAVPIATALIGRPLAAHVAAFCSFATTLTHFHQRGLGHTDLNLGHLFDLHGRWVIGDWGFAVQPGEAADPKMSAGRGPTRLMPPEQRIDVNGAPFGPVDVYSLAQALLVRSRRRVLPPALQSLLGHATVSEAGMRPTMSELRDGLAAAVAAGC